MSKWLILYTDGHTISDADMRPQDIPEARRVGVHSVAEETKDKTMRLTHRGFAYYGFHKQHNAWMAMEKNDVADYETLSDETDEILVTLMGRVVPNEEFWRMNAEMAKQKYLVGAARPKDC